MESSLLSTQDWNEFTERVLYFNVRKGSLQKVENLLKNGVSANVSYGGVSLLHLAVKYNGSNSSSLKLNFFKIAELLVKYGADINNNANVDGRSPLHMALLNGCLDMIQVLLNKRRENKNQENNEELPSDDNSLEQSQNVVDFLLKEGNSYKITKKEYPVLLEFAAKVGDEQSFEKILMALRDSEINNLNFSSRSTIFHTVVERGTCKMIEDLVKFGADINEKNEYGNTPLHSALQSGRFLHASCLLQCGACFREFDSGGNTALHLAARFGAGENIIEMILSTGIDVDIRYNITNETPLHLACEKDVETVKIFVNNGADINAKNFFGETPLQKAFVVGHSKIVLYLIKAGADVHSTDYKHRTALHYAVKFKVNVIELLIQRGVDVNGRDIHGKTALHYIGHNKSPDDFLLLETIIKLGVIDINAQDNKGNTPLHDILIFPGFHHFIQYFLELADVNALNTYGETPLSYAINTYINRFSLYYITTSNMEFMVAHLSIMIALKYNVCEENLQALNDEKIINFYRQCNDEIYEMEKKIGNSNVSLLDFLWKDVHKLAKFMRNEEVLEGLYCRSFVNDFPAYKSFLNPRIEKASKRNLLLERTAFIFNVCLKFELPNILLDKICEYLRNRDLRNFVEAFQFARPTVYK